MVFTCHSQTCFHFVASYAEQTYNRGILVMLNVFSVIIKWKVKSICFLNEISAIKF